MKAIVCILALLLLVGAAEARRASPGDGFQLNQRIVPLGDGTFYAVKDGKVIRARAVLTPPEQQEARKALMDRLNRHRYWHSGVPPRQGALERYLEARKGTPLRRDYASEAYFSTGRTKGG